MGSSTKIDSIAIGITDANNENGIVACGDLPLGGLVAKVRDAYFRKFWPFSKASLGDQQRGSRWWASWISNMGAAGTNDSGLPSNSRSIISTNGLNGSSSIVPSQSELNSPTAIDQEKEMNTDIAGNDVVVNEDANCERSQNDDYQIGNAVVVNEDVNCERSQNDDHGDNAVVGNEDVNSERSQQDDRRGNAVVENEDVNCERSQQDDERASAVVENGNVNCERSQKIDQTGNNAVVVNEDVNSERSQKHYQRATRSSKKVHPPPFRTYALRNKSTKNAVAEPLGNKRAEKQPNVGKPAVTETAACVEDTEPGESESISAFIGEAPSRRARTVRTRRVSEPTDKPNTIRETSNSRKDSLRSQKRKSLSGKASTAGAASGNASKSVDSGHGGTEPTESGVDIDPTKGRKKNVRFHVDVDDDEDDEDFYPSSARRTKKAKLAKKKRDTTAMDPSNKASSSVQPSLNENETFVDASTPSTGRGLGTGPGAICFGSRMSDNNQRSVPSSTVAASQSTVTQKDASTPNTDRGLGTGPGAFYFGSNNKQRSTPSSTVVAAQSSVPQKDASTPKAGRGLGTGPGAIYIGRSRNNNITNLRSTRPTVVAAQPSMPQKDVSVSDRKGKGIMGMSNNLPQEVPQKPKTPFMFDLNETYEEDVTSLEDNTNAAREEDRSVPVRSEQNSVEMFPPRRNSYVASSSVRPPPVQESRRSSILFPGYNPQWMGNVPMASPYHHPSPSTYQAIRAPHHHYRAPSPPVWASSMIPPQYHHHHLSPPAPFNMDYPSMFAQAPSSDTLHLSYYGAHLMNQAMMSHMDPRFRSSNTPVDHHGDFVFTPRHVRPLNQFDRLLELQRIHERTVFPRTISNQGRFQQRRNRASSSNASASHAENSSGSSVCIVNRYPGEITDSEPYMVQEEDLRVPERLVEFEQADDHVGPPTESG
ncbi:hypothetical protein Bca101_012091 [Brassica carinata]